MHANQYIIMLISFNSCVNKRNRLKDNEKVKFRDRENIGIRNRTKTNKIK